MNFKTPPVEETAKVEKLTENQLNSERARLEKLLAAGEMTVSASYRLVEAREALAKIAALKTNEQPEPES